MGKKIKTKLPESVADASVSKDATAPTKKSKKAAPVPSTAGDNADKPVKVSKKAKSGTIEVSPVQEKPLKRKQKAGKAELPAADEEDDNERTVPAKKVKQDSNIISAGTTIDQVPGMKLKKKKTKREKHAKAMDERRNKSRSKERQNVADYLETWKNSREKWRFEKLKQIYIQTHIFDEKLVNADVFPIALEYLCGTRGSSKESLKKSAESIIKEIDAAASTNEDVQESGKYQRARDVLQSLG